MIWGLIEEFSEATFAHMYIELNTHDDTSSKVAIWHMDGLLHFEEFVSSQLVESDTIFVF